jgi:Tfp pilus assembly protein PilN
MPEINLLNNRTDTISTTAWDSRGRFWAIMLGVILILLLVGSFALLFWNSSLNTQSQNLTQENLTIQRNLTSQQESLAGAKGFQAQLANVKTLLDNHTYLTPLINELDKMTYINAQYNSLDIARNGSIHLEGRVNTYNDLSKLLLGLSTSPNLKNVKLLSILPASVGTTNYFLFSITLNTVPEIFTKK